ncbi:hypothetical protein [Streptomyces prasinus]|uniref:hypothetical protein n=1 Tax=Streptomyces prasinus TaxID=67345 RepID=UPI0006EBA856|nr:hypothetical protein [Streptomyces prasinus]
MQRNDNTPLANCPDFAHSWRPVRNRRLRDGATARTEGASDEAALTALLDALRAGDWDEGVVEAALRCTPYQDDGEPAGEPDGAAARAVLEGFRPVLRRARDLRDPGAEDT